MITQEKQLTWSKNGVNDVSRENFSPTERRIAKIGLAIAALVALLYTLHLNIPDVQEITTLFGSLGVLLLMLATSCVLVKPAEAARIHVKKVAGFGRRFNERDNSSSKTTFTKSSMRKTSNRTRARSRTCRSRRSHSVSTGSSNGSSETSGDSDPPGDPSKQFHTATTCITPSNSVTSSLNALSRKPLFNGLAVECVFLSFSYIRNMAERSI